MIDIKQFINTTSRNSPKKDNKSKNEIFHVPTDTLWEMRKRGLYMGNTAPNTTVQKLRAEMQQGKIKPIKATREEFKNGIINDGKHRLIVAREIGLKTYPLDIQKDKRARNMAWKYPDNYTGTDGTIKTWKDNYTEYQVPIKKAYNARAKYQSNPVRTVRLTYPTDEPLKKEAEKELIATGKYLDIYGPTHAPYLEVEKLAVQKKRDIMAVEAKAKGLTVFPSRKPFRTKGQYDTKTYLRTRDKSDDILEPQYGQWGNTKGLSPDEYVNEMVKALDAPEPLLSIPTITHNEAERGIWGEHRHTTLAAMRHGDKTIPILVEKSWRDPEDKKLVNFGVQTRQKYPPVENLNFPLEDNTSKNSIYRNLGVGQKDWAIHHLTDNRRTQLVNEMLYGDDTSNNMAWIKAFHGTTKKNYDKIMLEGFKPGSITRTGSSNDPAVHLTTNKEYARGVGKYIVPVLVETDDKKTAEYQKEGKDILAELKQQHGSHYEDTNLGTGYIFKSPGITHQDTTDHIAVMPGAIKDIKILLEDKDSNNMAIVYHGTDKLKEHFILKHGLKTVKERHADYQKETPKMNIDIKEVAMSKHTDPTHTYFFNNPKEALGWAKVVSSHSRIKPAVIEADIPDEELKRDINMHGTALKKVGGVPADKLKSYPLSAKDSKIPKISTTDLNIIMGPAYDKDSEDKWIKDANLPARYKYKQVAIADIFPQEQLELKNKYHVAKIAESGEIKTPILLWNKQVGRNEPLIREKDAEMQKYALRDGHHRYLAAQSRGDTHILGAIEELPLNTAAWRRIKGYPAPKNKPDIHPEAEGWALRGQKNYPRPIVMKIDNDSEDMAYVGFDKPEQKSQVKVMEKIFEKNPRLKFKRDKSIKNILPTTENSAFNIRDRTISISPFNTQTPIDTEALLQHELTHAAEATRMGRGRYAGHSVYMDSRVYDNRVRNKRTFNSGNKKNSNDTKFITPRQEAIIESKGLKYYPESIYHYYTPIEINAMKQGLKADDESTRSKSRRNQYAVGKILRSIKPIPMDDLKEAYENDLKSGTPLRDRENIWEEQPVVDDTSTNLSVSGRLLEKYAPLLEHPTPNAARIYQPIVQIERPGLNTTELGFVDYPTKDTANKYFTNPGMPIENKIEISAARRSAKDLITGKLDFRKMLGNTTAMQQNWTKYWGEAAERLKTKDKPSTPLKRVVEIQFPISDNGGDED